MTEEEILKRIGEGLQDLRLKGGYGSYESFAYDKRVNRNTVYRAEKGENINLKTFIHLLKIHDISLKDFFKEFE